MKHAALAAVAFLALAAPAAAIDPVPFGDIGFGGTGCPDGTADIFTNDARTSALVTMSDYVVGEGRRSTDRKTCAIAMPVSVPEGVAVAIRGVAVLGTVDLPEGVEATVNIEAFVAGDVGEVHELTLTGARTGNWFRSVVIPWDEMVWTGCGQDSNLRINTSLRTRGNEGAKVSIDNMALFRFATKAC